MYENPPNQYIKRVTTKYFLHITFHAPLMSGPKGEPVPLSSATDKKILRSLSSLAVRAALSSFNDEMVRLMGILTARLEELERPAAGRCVDMEHYHRRQNLRIFGVKEKTREDTDRIVVDLCWDKLGVDLPAFTTSRSHRVGGQPKLAPVGRDTVPSTSALSATRTL
ncbi:hypothetical protein J6590_064930 [Homalodisca vitripennis]|nr:hypothetical protein J6590_064930 [Homalodisca vitripennis]